MRRFIQSQLLATRIASDPLAATACKQQLLSGDSHRVLAIRTLLDRSQPDWAEVSDRLIRSALLDYQRCLEALETANLQLHSYYQSNSTQLHRKIRFKSLIERTESARWSCLDSVGPMRCNRGTRSWLRNGAMECAKLKRSSA